MVSLPSNRDAGRGIAGPTPPSCRRGLRLPVLCRPALPPNPAAPVPAPPGEGREQGTAAASPSPAPAGRCRTIHLGRGPFSDSSSQPADLGPTGRNLPEHWCTLLPRGTRTLAGQAPRLPSEGSKDPSGPSARLPRLGPHARGARVGAWPSTATAPPSLSPSPLSRPCHSTRLRGPATASPRGADHAPCPGRHVPVREGGAQESHTAWARRQGGSEQAAAVPLPPGARGDIPRGRPTSGVQAAAPEGAEHGRPKAKAL